MDLQGSDKVSATAPGAASAAQAKAALLALGEAEVAPDLAGLMQEHPLVLCAGAALAGVAAARLLSAPRGHAVTEAPPREPAPLITPELVIKLAQIAIPVIADLAQKRQRPASKSVVESRPSSDCPAPSEPAPLSPSPSPSHRP